MINPKINYDNLVRQLVPPHKRQSVRLGILRRFAGRLKELHAEFYLWRNDIRMIVNVNSQVRVLEGYLRKKYNEPFSIKVLTYDDGLMNVCLEEEGLTMMPGIGNDEAVLQAVALEGELREQFGDTDFMVYIPAGVDKELIVAEIEKYKQVLTTYKIIRI